MKTARHESTDLTLRGAERALAIDPNDEDAARVLAWESYRRTGDCGVTDLRLGWSRRCGNKQRSGAPQSYVEACPSCRLRHLRDLAVRATRKLCVKHGIDLADALNWVRGFKLWRTSSLRTDARFRRTGDLTNDRRDSRGAGRVRLIRHLTGLSLGCVLDVPEKESFYSAGLAWSPGEPPAGSVAEQIVTTPEDTLYAYWTRRTAKLRRSWTGCSRG